MRLWPRKQDDTEDRGAANDEPDNRTRDVVTRVGSELDRLSSLVNQLEQSVLIIQHLEEKRDNAKE